MHILIITRSINIDVNILSIRLFVVTNTHVHTLMDDKTKCRYYRSIKCWKNKGKKIKKTIFMRDKPSYIPIKIWKNYEFLDIYNNNISCQKIR